MFTEVEAARLLYLDGLLAQAELHLSRARDAEARILALGRGAPPPGESSHGIEAGARPSGAGLPRRELWNQLRAAARAHRRLARRAWMERMGLDRPGRRAAAAAATLALLGALGAGVWHIRTTYVPPPLPSNLVLPLVPTYNTLFVQYADLQRRMEPGTRADARGIRGFADMATVLLGRVRRDRSMEISLDATNAYTLRFFSKDQAVAELSLTATPAVDGLRVERREVPAGAVKTGYDRIDINHDQGEGLHFMGHLLLGASLLDAAPDGGIKPPG